MPALADSDIHKWSYDLHTKIKHEILQDYLGLWTTVLGRSKATLAYVDAFAGRGRYHTGEPGSPLLAIDTVLGALDDRPGKASKVTFHFVERHSGNAQDLQRELDRYAPAQDPRVKYTVYPTAFSQVSSAIAAEIQRNAQPSFFFVDPFGYNGIPMQVLKSLLHLHKAEVFINLMYDFANRAVGINDDPTLAQTLDALFNTPGWRTIGMAAREDRERAFLLLYRQQLKLAGAAYVLPFRMGDDQRERTLYYLLHATKHIDGVRIMKDVMVKSSSPGQLGYAGQARHQMRPIFDLSVTELPRLLQRELEGQELTFKQILDRTFDETGTCRKRDYRDCLLALERAGQVTIRRVVSTSSPTVREGDKIHFAAGNSPVQGGFDFAG